VNENVSEWNHFRFSRLLPILNPFDIFAASFYLVSRYGEYLEFQADEFGRFRCSIVVSQNVFSVFPLSICAKELQKLF